MNQKHLGAQAPPLRTISSGEWDPSVFPESSGMTKRRAMNLGADSGGGGVVRQYGLLLIPQFISDSRDCLASQLRQNGADGVSSLPTKLKLGYHLPLPIVLSTSLWAHVPCIPQEKGQGLYVNIVTVSRPPSVCPQPHSESPGELAPQMFGRSPCPGATRRILRVHGS